MMAQKKSASQSDESKEMSSPSRKHKTVLTSKKVASARAASRSGKKPSTSSSVSQDGPPADPPDLRARIADRAHELYMHRGGHHGQDQEDWFEAERQVLEEGC